MSTPMEAQKSGEELRASLLSLIARRKEDSMIRDSDRNALAKEVELVDPVALAEEFSPDDPARKYLDEIGKIPPLSSGEEEELARQISQGDQAAKRRLTEASLLLVVSIATKYIGRGLHILDLIQEGNTALLRAVEDYDLTKGNEFSGYAAQRIRQGITRALADSGIHYWPSPHVMEAIRKAATCNRKLVQELGREPTAEEIAAELGIPAEKAAEANRTAADPRNQDTTIGSFMEDSRTPGPASNALLAEALKELSDTLTEREVDVLRVRIGMYDGRTHTLEEAAQIFGVTPERIRQIENKAIRKLRHPNRAKKIRDFYC